MSKKIKGVVNKIIFEKDGFYIASIENFEDESTFVIKINIPKLYEGVPMEFVGDWINDKNYGMQFKACNGLEIKPETPSGLIRYLSSKLFPGIGEAIAKKIISFYGEKNVLEVLENDIESLISIPGISKKKLLELKISWKRNRGIADAMIFLYSHGISTILATKIYEVFGYECIEKIEENPYILIDNIKNVGFKKADEIALNVGIKRDSIERLSAAIQYILGENNNFGNCFLTFNQLSKELKDFLKIETTIEIEKILETLKEDKKIVKIKNNELKGEYVYYIKHIYESEVYCAKKIKELVNNKNKISKNVICEKLNILKVELGEEQREAIIKTISSNVSILTGGPGTGKSFTINTILDILDSLGKTYVLTAPTGRAAQRMNEATNREAKTIHRLLKWSASSEDFEKNEENPIKADYIIVDETSMVDIKLSHSLLRAIKQKSKIIFVGDVDQLPPVGPGSFFKDLIDSNIVNKCVLSKIYRQKENSNIVRFAHQINKGEVPNIPSPFKEKDVWERGEDCIFIESGLLRNKKEDEYSTIDYNIGIQETISKLYCEKIKKYLGEDIEIQVLTLFKNKGVISTKEINYKLQEKINPYVEGRPELKIGKNLFRVGDRVMQTSNNYMLDVFNGDIGEILMIDYSSFSCLVEFGSGKKVLYKDEFLFELELARSCTIHKSQGSEFDCVIIPILKEQHIMLYKSIIYTAITRAKKMAIFVGERGALKKAIENTSSQERQTMLKEFLIN